MQVPAVPAQKPPTLLSPRERPSTPQLPWQQAKLQPPPRGHHDHAQKTPTKEAKVQGRLVQPHENSPEVTKPAPESQADDLPARSGRVTRKEPKSPAYVSAFGRSMRTPRPVIDLKYPCCVFPCRRWSEFPAHLEHEGTRMNFGGLVFSIRPDLPSGLKIDRDSGAVQGCPFEERDETQFEVTVLFPADGLLGGAEAKCTVQLSVRLPPFRVDYPPVDATLSSGEGLPPLDTRRRLGGSGPKFMVLPVTDGRADSFEVSPPLPRGMRFNKKTGEISGLPEGGEHNLLFEVFACNPVGTTSCKLGLEVQANSQKAKVRLFTFDDAHELRTPHSARAPLLPKLPGSGASGRERSLPSQRLRGFRPGVSVNDEFSKMLPCWRSKINSDGRRADLVSRWREETLMIS